MYIYEQVHFKIHIHTPPYRNSLVVCHTTNGPPTIGPPGPSAAAMNGLPRPYTAATLGPG